MLTNEKFDSKIKPSYNVFNAQFEFYKLFYYKINNYNIMKQICFPKKVQWSLFFINFWLLLFFQNENDKQDKISWFFQISFFVMIQKKFICFFVFFIKTTKKHLNSGFSNQ